MIFDEHISFARLKLLYLKEEKEKSERTTWEEYYSSMSFLKVGIIIHSIFCCFKPLRACPNSHGLSGFKPRLVGFFVLFSKQARFQLQCIHKQGREKKAERAFSQVQNLQCFFFQYIYRSSNLTYLKAYKPASRGRRLFSLSFLGKALLIWCFFTPLPLIRSLWHIIKLKLNWAPLFEARKAGEKIVL